LVVTITFIYPASAIDPSIETGLPPRIDQETLALAQRFEREDAFCRLGKPAAGCSLHTAKLAMFWVSGSLFAGGATTQQAWLRGSLVTGERSMSNHSLR
jgi:hypothetical protein